MSLPRPPTLACLLHRPIIAKNIAENTEVRIAENIQESIQEKLKATIGRESAKDNAGNETDYSDIVKEGGSTVNSSNPIFSRSTSVVIAWLQLKTS